MQAVIAIFGIAWMGDTFLNGNMAQLTASIEGIVRQMPWLFGIALFVMSILLYSQAATVRAFSTAGHRFGHIAVYADSHVPCRKRIFLHTELSHRSRGYQL